MKKIMIIDNRYIDIAEKVWGDRFIIIPSVTSKKLPQPVSAHPDMALFPLCDSMLICEPSVFNEYNERLAPYGIKLLCGEKNITCNYPKDIAYNVLRIGKYAFAKFSETDGKICEFLKQNGISMKNINQGYAKCSSCVFENSIITADRGIYNMAKHVNINALLISAGDVVLNGYNYGFIGGASGTPDGKEVFFFGDLAYHKDGEKISKFIKENGGTISFIDGSELIDVGTIMFV